MKIVAALLAGKGVYEMGISVINRLASDHLIDQIFVLTPFGKYHPDYKWPKKTFHINEWKGADSHDKTGINREVLRIMVKNYLPDADWFWFGDEDAMPGPGFFETLSTIHYDFPALLTGITLNADGRRWYDICSFQTDGYPFCVPYEDWQNPRWAKDLYASGNQHIMNRSGFLLDVPYPDIPGEDPHYCWAFKKAGGRLMFDPRLVMRLLKMHHYANLGYAPCLPT